MPEDPTRIARMFRKLSPDDDPGPRKRPVPTVWIVGLVALLTLTLPLAVLSSVLGGDDGGSNADLAAVRVSAAEADDDEARDDDRDPAGGDPTVRETADGNTQRDGAYSISGNTRGADTSFVAAPAAQGFSPAYEPAGDSASGASASG